MNPIECIAIGNTGVEVTHSGLGDGAVSGMVLADGPYRASGYEEALRVITLTRMSDIFEKRCEARQNEIRDGSVAGVGYHKRHNPGESTIEGQRKAGSRSQSPKGLARLTNAATPSMPPHSQANRALLRPSGVRTQGDCADRHSPLGAALLRRQNRYCL